jgi:hypothetical protein
MIQTRVYYPTDPEKFRRNLRGRWLDYDGEVGSYNSKESMSKRTDGIQIYHVLDATVFSHAPTDDKGRVNITANVTTSVPGKIKAAKSLLEKITEVELIEGNK